MLDAMKVITGQGMPSYRHHENGDLYIRIAVKFPENLPESVIPALESALPKRNAIPKFKKGTHVEEVTLEEPNDRQRKQAQNGDEMDEDDEERGHGVQCAQRESPDQRTLCVAMANLNLRMIILILHAHLFGP